MDEKQSEIGRDVRLGILLWHKWQAEIEKAVDKVRFRVAPVGKRTRNDKWFRRQWYKSMMRNRKRESVAGFKA